MTLQHPGLAMIFSFSDITGKVAELEWVDVGFSVLTARLVCSVQP